MLQCEFARAIFGKAKFNHQKARPIDGRPSMTFSAAIAGFSTPWSMLGWTYCQWTEARHNKKGWNETCEIMMGKIRKTHEHVNNMMWFFIQVSHSSSNMISNICVSAKLQKGWVQAHPPTANPPSPGHSRTAENQPHPGSAPCVTHGHSEGWEDEQIFPTVRYIKNHRWSKIMEKSQNHSDCSGNKNGYMNYEILVGW